MTCQALFNTVHTMLNLSDPYNHGNGNPLQYSCLENSMDGGAWKATVRGVTKSWTRLSDFTSLTIMDLKLIWIALPYFNFSIKIDCLYSWGRGTRRRGKRERKENSQNISHCQLFHARDRPQRIGIFSFSGPVGL